MAGDVDSVWITGLAKSSCLSYYAGMTESDDKPDFSALFSEMEIGDFEDFSEHDHLGFREFGERMADSMLSLSNAPLVVMLEGPWGSGKTVFIKQWAALLRRRKYPVIRMDAFAVDYMQDPFVAIAGEIASLEESLGLSESALQDLKKFFEQFKKDSKKFEQYTSAFAEFVLKFVAVKGSRKLRSATAGLVDAEGFVKLLEQSDDSLREQVKDYDAGKKSISRLRESLTKVAEESSKAALVVNPDQGEAPEEEAVRPLFFIVDELDRCRPDFALGVLEVIKHFFSVDGVHFVLVTNRTQIEASVRHVYGCDKPQSQAYLEKFSHLSLLMPPAKFGGHHGYVRYLENFFASRGYCDSPDPSATSAIHALHFLALSSTKVNLREIKKIMLLLLFSDALRGVSYYDNPKIYLPSLPAFMKVLSPGHYKQILNGTLDLSAMKDFLKQHVEDGMVGGRDRNYSMQFIFGMWALLSGSDEEDVRAHLSDIFGELHIDFDHMKKMISEHGLSRQPYPEICAGVGDIMERIKLPD